MSLQPALIGPVPEETARVARAAFPHGTSWMRLRDEVGTVFTDAAFASLFPRRGQPALAPWRLGLVLLLQYAEHLSDRQAANAVRSRIDWKYLLGLELTDSGFDPSVLSEFRTRLVGGEAEEQLLLHLLEVCKQKKLFQERGPQRTDATHVLGRIRTLNRLENVGETLRAALNTLAVAHPQWVQTHVPAQWVERYGSRIEEQRLPTRAGERGEYAEQIGRDGHALLDLLACETTGLLRSLPSVEVLRQVWVQQFYRVGEQVRWRSEQEGMPNPGALIRSPYDSQARYARKRTTTWVGYKVHLSETCAADQPHLITHVQTTSAEVSDAAALEPIHQGMQAQGVLPSVHLVDAGYVNAEALLRTQDHYGVELLGPVPQDGSWQAAAGKGFAAGDFTLDWAQQKAICPAQRQSAEWTASVDARKQPVIKVRFSPQDCRSCAHRSDCTRAARRSLTLRPQAQHEALQARRQQQRQSDFGARYRSRAGIEGTISQGVRAFDLRRSRYLGHAKTHLQHVATAAAINLVRVVSWLGEQRPAATRRSTFARLIAPPIAA